MTKAKFPLSSSDDDALIARALHESAKRYIDDFVGDPDVGKEMLAILETRFPDHARALADADCLREALEAGFLPPASGATSESVRDFLDRKKAKSEAPTKRPVETYRNGDIIPF